MAASKKTLKELGISGDKPMTIGDLMDGKKGGSKRCPDCGKARCECE